MALACLDTLVALSNQDYPCFTDTRPGAWNTSASGHSLTDADYGFRFLEDAAVPGWGLLQRARAKAIIQFKTDLAAALRNYFNDSMVRFSGFMGKLESSGLTTVSSSRNYVGHRITPRPMRGVKQVIKTLYLGLDTAGTYTVHVTSNDPTFTTQTRELTADGSTFVKTLLEVPIELPYYSEAVETLRYYLTVHLPGGEFPLANALRGCKSCSGTPGYAPYADVDGFTASGLTGQDIQTSTPAYGLVTDSYITCEELAWICQMQVIGDKDAPDLIARTIQLYGAAYIASELTESVKINLITLYGLEQIQNKRVQLLEMYANNIQYIAQKLPRNLTDCWTCKEDQQFHRTKNLV